jgi:hypothetical protein
MRIALPFLLLFAPGAFAQGANFKGTVSGHLFRDLSDNPHGLFQSRTNRFGHDQSVLEFDATSVRSTKCAIRLLEIPAKDSDAPMIVGQPKGRSIDPKIAIAPAIPACPKRVADE